MLELGLVNYAMQKVVGRGFVPMMTPDLVRESVLEKCGFQPRGDNTQVSCKKCFSTVTYHISLILLGECAREVQDSALRRQHTGELQQDVLHVIGLSEVVV